MTFLVMKNPRNRAVLDEMTNVYREVYEREKKQAYVMGQTERPPDKLDRRVSFEIEKYINRIKNALDKVYNQVQLSPEGIPADISNVISFYNELAAYVRSYASIRDGLSVKDTAFLRERFQSLGPVINQIQIVGENRNTLTSIALQQLNAIIDNLRTDDYADPVFVEPQRALYSSELISQDPDNLRFNRIFSELRDIFNRPVTTINMPSRRVPFTNEGYETESIISDLPAETTVPGAAQAQDEVRAAEEQSTLNAIEEEEAPATVYVDGPGTGAAVDLAAEPEFEGDLQAEAMAAVPAATVPAAPAAPAAPTVSPDDPRALALAAQIAEREVRAFAYSAALDAEKAIIKSAASASQTAASGDFNNATEMINSPVTAILIEAARKWLPAADINEIIQRAYDRASAERNGRAPTQKKAIIKFSSLLKEPIELAVKRDVDRRNRERDQSLEALRAEYEQLTGVQRGRAARPATGRGRPRKNKMSAPVFSGFLPQRSNPISYDGMRNQVWAVQRRNK